METMACGAGSGGGALVHGAADEVELRRLVGGAVRRTGEGEVDGSASVRAAVGRAVRAGLELQAAARAATAGFEWRVREEVRRYKLVGQYAKAWRERVREGGPARVAALRAVACARAEAEAELGRVEARVGGRVGGAV